jgi:hypothetical protein
MREAGGCTGAIDYSVGKEVPGLPFDLWINAVGPGSVKYILENSVDAGLKIGIAHICT